MKRGILCRGAIKAVVKAAAATVGKVVAVAHGDKVVAVEVLLLQEKVQHPVPQAQQELVVLV